MFAGPGVDGGGSGLPGDAVMRIMVVTDQYAPMVGGVPTVARALSLGLARRGHAVALLAPSPGLRRRLGADEQVTVHYQGSVPWPGDEGRRLACWPGAAAGRRTPASAPDVIPIHPPVTLGVGARAVARQLRI